MKKIEKIKRFKYKGPGIENDEYIMQLIISVIDIQDKINELIDALNEKEEG